MQFNPEMMILARESRSLTQTDLADIIPFAQGTISKIEGGVLAAPANLVSSLANELKYSEEFFYQSDPVFGFNSAVFFHRKRKALPEGVLRKLHAQMNLTRMRIKRLFRVIRADNPLRFYPLLVDEYKGGVVDIARTVRSSWMMPSGPVRNVMEAIESAGGVIVKFDFGTRQIDAISEWTPHNPPIFLVNDHHEISGARMRLTLAHEVAHVMMHTESGPRPDIEMEANKFAAEFLMPRQQIKASLYGLTVAKLADLKRIWKVSMQALIQRAYELKTLTEGQRKYMIINVTRASGGRMQELADDQIPIEQPSLVSRLIAEHVGPLGYSVSDLAKLLFFTDEDEFRLQFLREKRLRLV
jgi:Zn-dependent peptidase ImmA (M78 family)/transcriptional regulator with XRE-family HTH domain